MLKLETFVCNILAGSTSEVAYRPLPSGPGNHQEAKSNLESEVYIRTGCIIIIFMICEDNESNRNYHCRSRLLIMFAGTSSVFLFSSGWLS